MAAFGGRVAIDLGTGDGRLPFALARAEPFRLFIGVDASAAGLREVSNRATRAGMANVLYVRAAVEARLPELAGVSDGVTAILPWGSLLAGLVRPIVPIVRNVRSLCQPGATLTVVFGVDPDRDDNEARRLDLPEMDRVHFDGRLAEGYAAAGFTVTSVRAVQPEDLARWPSTWARRLAFGRPRPVFQLEARCQEAKR